MQRLQTSASRLRRGGQTHRHAQARGTFALNTPSVTSPRCIVIAGPNGAGKTTFAHEFLPYDAGIIHFVNADLIASGLSPLRPELAAIAAGRLFLIELNRLANLRVDFALKRRSVVLVTSSTCSDGRLRATAFRLFFYNSPRPGWRSAGLPNV